MWIIILKLQFQIKIKGISFGKKNKQKNMLTTFLHVSKRLQICARDTGKYWSYTNKLSTMLRTTDIWTCHDTQEPNSTAERGSILFDKYISPTTRRQYQLQTSVR